MVRKCDLLYECACVCVIMGYITVAVFIGSVCRFEEYCGIQVQQRFFLFLEKLIILNEF